MARHFIDVARAVKSHIPEDKRDTHTAIDNLIASSAYMAPEQASDLWGRLGNEVTWAVGPPPLTEDWQVNTVAALMDKTADDVRKMQDYD